MSKQHSKRRSVPMIVPLLLSLWACSDQDDFVRNGAPAELETHKGPVQGTLALEEKSPNHISGVFVDGMGGLRFDVMRTHGQGWILLDTLDGRTILRVVRDFDAENTEGPGTDYRIDLSSRSSIAAMPLEDLLALPEARSLPALSHELGAHGIRGDTHPSSYPLHFLALALARSSSSNHGEMRNQPSEGTSIAEGAQALVSCQTEPQGDAFS